MAMRRRAIAPALVVAFLLVARAHAAPLQVCVFSFHSPYEVQIFESRLPAGDFDVVDLSHGPC